MAFPSANHLAYCIFLTLMLSRGIKARPDSRLYFPEIDIPQYIMEETETMNDDMYSDLKKYPANNPAFMAKRQNLRNLFRTSYGDEIGTDVLDDVILDHIPPPLAFKKDLKFKNRKEHAEKKNIISEKKISEKSFYMQPCPFKICSMGRKRNARDLQY